MIYDRRDGPCSGSEAAWLAGEIQDVPWGLDELLELLEGMPVFEDQLDLDEAICDLADYLAGKYGTEFRSLIWEDLIDLIED